jgi:hypothetical protein
MPGLLSRWIANLFRPTRSIRNSARRPLNIEQLECREVPAYQGTGSGLIANYYSDPNFTALAATRTDAAVNFSWGAGSPAAGLPADGFSARWTGQVQAQFSETYTFSVAADEGVRLWVNGQKIIDSSASAAAGEWSGSVALKAGEAYDVRLEYVDRSGASNVRLSWASPSTPKAVIPASQLYADGAWLDGDLGTSAGGSLSATSSSYTVRGSGVPGGTADQGHFAYQSIDQDGNVIARLDSLTGTAARGGVMLRGGTGASDAFAALSVVAGQGVVFQSRTAAGVPATQTAAVAAGAQPWLKLVRNGPMVSGYVSDTGAAGSWRLVGTATVSLGRTALGGLVTGSGGALATGVFSNVTAAATVPVGANVDAVHDWSLANAFVDLMKQARQFVTPDWSRPAATDANGWPTEAFTTIVQTGFTNTAHIYNGVYKLSFTGRADVDAWVTPGTISNVVYNPTTNRTTADVTVNASDASDVWYFGLTFRNVGSGVRDVKLIRPGYDPNTTQVFTNDFLRTIAPFTTLRFMDFAETNDNPVVNWADRARPTDATQSTAKGAAWEYMIQLANQTGKDLWINVPFGATDDYVRQLASLLKAQLNPDRAVYVEYSNELWNGGFSQSQANLQAAVAEVHAGGSNLAYPGETDTSQWEWAFRRTARRITEISNVFSSVWGAGAIDTRVRPVLATQVAVPYILQTQLDFLQKTYGDPRKFLYAAAGAPYFAVGDLDQRTNLTADQIISALSSAVDANDAVLDQTAGLATYYGLNFLAYEGGPDTFGPNNIAAKKAASLDPRMQALTVRYMNDWYARGGGLFNWYMAGPTNYDTQYGTWGLTNDINNPNAPKAAGVAQVQQAPRVEAQNGAAVGGEVLAKNSVGAQPTTDPYPRWLQDGAALDYMVRAPQAGTYQLRVRYAEVTAGGQLQVLVNDKPAGTLSLPVTGPGYDSQWAPNSFADSVPVTVNLEAGLNVVRLAVVKSGYTLYSLKFDGVPGAVSPPPVTPPASPPPPPPPAGNQAPTVTGSGATSPVTGTTSSLTAAGADDGGEGALSYTWSLASGPAGVSFSASGTNAAKATTATFSRAGSYVLRVTATDAGGLTATDDIPVTVAQTLSGLTITPASVTLPTGGSQAFSAGGTDQFGQSMTLGATAWRLAGVGTLTPAGDYTAPTAAGSATVNAYSGGKSVSAAVIITATTTTTGGATLTSLDDLTRNGSAWRPSGRLRLAGSTHQAGSAFTMSKVGVSRFDASFQFQLSPIAGWAPNTLGNGITFAIQGQGESALGNVGTGLGFTGIHSGLAVRYDAVKGELAIESGTKIISRLSLGGSGPDLGSGRVFSSQVSYDGAALTVTLTDTATGATASLRTAVNLTAAVGGSSAYVGFTGGTATKGGSLDVLSWSYAAK